MPSDGSCRSSTPSSRAPTSTRRSLGSRSGVGRGWLATPGKRPSAWAWDESILRNHIAPTLGSRRLGTIKPGDVQALVTAWGTKAVPRTLRRQYDVLPGDPQRGGGGRPHRPLALPGHPAAGGRPHQPSRRHRRGAGGHRQRHGRLRAHGVRGRRPRAPAGRVRRPYASAGSTSPVRPSRWPNSSPGALEGPWCSDRPSRRPARRGITGADPEEFLFPAPYGGQLDYAHFRLRIWIPAVASAASKGSPSTTCEGPNATGMVARRGEPEDGPHPARP